MPVPDPVSGEPEGPAPRPGWGALYALVLGALAAMIAFLAWLTERFK